MAAPKLPPVPPLTPQGFADPVWAKWLSLLRQQVVVNLSAANLVFTPGNGFTGSFTPSGSNVALTIGTSVTGILKGNGTGVSAATPGVDYVQTVSVTAPITNTGTAANPNIGHATSGVVAGTYTKVTVDVRGHVTVGANIASGDVTGALGYTPLNPANNLSDVSNVGTSRTNLGLGTAATQNTGTSGATLPFLNGVNTWSGAQTFSAAIIPSQTIGITGTTTNNNANAGAVGEFLTGASTGTALTSGTTANVASVSLTAGDWDVQGICTFNPAATTQVTGYTTGVSTTTGAFGTANTGTRIKSLFASVTGVNAVAEQPTPVVRVSLGATTTVFLVANTGFTVSTMSADGFIKARRVR